MALDISHPTARQLAQMRTFATQHKLPEPVADMLARRGVSPARTAMMAPGLDELRRAAEAARSSAAELAEMAREYLDAMPAEGEPAPEQMRAAARAVISGAAQDVRAAICRKFGDKLTGADVEMIAGRHTTTQAAMQAAAEMIVDRAIAADGPEMRESRYSITAEHDHGPDWRARMIAGVAARMRGDHSGATAYERDGARHTLPEIAMMVARNNGLRPASIAEGVRMAHSTDDFAHITAGILQLETRRRVEQRQPDLARVASRRDRPDYRVSYSVDLYDAEPALKEVEEDGELTSGRLADTGEVQPTMRDFGALVNISNKALANDASALAMFADATVLMTRKAIEAWRRVLLEPLEANSGAGQTMSDTNPAFHSTRGNVAASGGALSVTTLGAARLALRKQKDGGGTLFAIQPYALVVPAELETSAQQVLAEIEAGTVDAVNPFSGSLELVVEPGLADPAAWYLTASPTDLDGLVWGSLEGQPGPVVETEAMWDRLGLSIRSFWAIDAKMVEARAWFRNPGA